MKIPNFLRLTQTKTTQDLKGEKNLKLLKKYKGLLKNEKNRELYHFFQR